MGSVTVYIFIPSLSRTFMFISVSLLPPLFVSVVVLHLFMIILCLVLVLYLCGCFLFAALSQL